MVNERRGASQMWNLCCLKISALAKNVMGWVGLTSFISITKNSRSVILPSVREYRVTMGCYPQVNIVTNQEYAKWYWNLLPCKSKLKMTNMAGCLSAQPTHRLMIPLWLLTQVSQFKQALVKGHYPSQVTQACSGVNKTKTKEKTTKFWKQNKRKLPQIGWHTLIKGIDRTLAR